ncbi:TPA: ABC transporter permease subunit [Escherichia coli]
MFTATEAVPVAKVVAGNKRYPGVVALDNVNFTLNKGEVRALLGKNGAGKSTLIRMLTGSERPDSGDIWIGETRLEGDEATLTRRAAELGVRAVYQELSLVEGLTVAENLCLGQWPRRNGMIDYLQMAQDAQLEVPLAIACLLVLLLGALMGTLAGVLRGVFNVPSFVATLGLWSALRGMGLFMTNALPVPIDENEVLDWLGGQFLGVPVSALIMMVLFALFVFISRKTAFGRSVFAVGGNATAAQLCGINVRRVRILIFTLSGLLAAVTGILLAARLGSGNAGAANGLEFDVIAAVVVGGTALSGGRGSLFGTLLGVLVITLIGNGLVLLGINSFFQQVVRGVIIVVAVLANILLTQRSSKAKR